MARTISESGSTASGLQPGAAASQPIRHRDGSTPSPSVRELIADLAQVEDAVRALPAYVAADDGSQMINPELLSILERERDIVCRLRARGPLADPSW